MAAASRSSSHDHQRSNTEEHKYTSKLRFSMGRHTLKVPMELFALNRRRLCEALRREAAACPGGGDAVVLLQGGDNVSLNSSDVDYLFRQEGYFHWCFGVEEPGFYGAVLVSSGESILFMPLLPEDYAVWMGRLRSPADFKLKYEVDHVFYVDQMKDVLAKTPQCLLLTLSGTNTDSGLTNREATFDGIDEFKVDNELLYPIIAECRVIKTPLEVEVLRYACKISCEAHVQVMKKMRVGMHEYQAEALFLHYAYHVGGCRHVGYTCICGSGTNGATLHYGHAGDPNKKVVQKGEMCLFDMGAVYCGYTADITCSFPANGKFTMDQRVIYTAVLRASKAVLGAARPGVSWVDMHLLASRVMLGALVEAEILQGEVDEMMEAGLGYVFQPHGLGHLLGVDVHDVGGYLRDTPPRPEAPGPNKLRTARVLQAGMVVTIEPGCYFVDMLLDRAMADPDQNRFLVFSAMERLRGFGGVRIEDDVLITEDGCVNLSSGVPREIADIEELMAHGQRPLDMDKEADAYINIINDIIR